MATQMPDRLLARFRFADVVVVSRKRDFQQVTDWPIVLYDQDVGTTTAFLGHKVHFATFPPHPPRFSQGS